MCAIALLSTGLFAAAGTRVHALAHVEHDQQAAYVCPMHPDVTAAAAGTCPKCGMALVKGDASPADAYRVEVETTPAPPRAGQPTRLRFSVREPRTGGLVTRFAIVHERPYHVFLLSQDLEFYEHLHPVQQKDGAFAMDVTLPREGHYKIYSDFLPTGGSPQVTATRLVTADARGDVASAMARLVPDATFTKTVGTMAVTLDLPKAGLVAGRSEDLRFRVADASSGAPVRNLQPYLGAFGHTLILSEDTEHAVHAHPEGKATGSGGPGLTFHALFPEAGRYRIWTQLKRGGVVSTVVFTVTVGAGTAPTGL